MAAKTVWNSDGSITGVTLDRKTLIVDSKFNEKEINMGDEKYSVSGATAINAASAPAISIVGAAKALGITTGAKGSTVVGSSKADKITLGSGADVVVYTPGSGANAVGNDVITGYKSNDTIRIEGKSSVDATFVDKGATVTVTFKGANDKLTVTKSTSNDPIAFAFSGDNSKTAFNYGALPTKATLDTNKQTLTLDKSTSGSVNAGNIASTIKNINASNVTGALYIVGNGQANSITLGAGGGTVNASYSNDAAKSKTKATADKIYGSTKAADTIIINSSLGGSDQIYNYDASMGDKIVVNDMTAEEIAASIGSSKGLKDTGSVVTATLNKAKVAVNGNVQKVVFQGSDSGTVIYGPNVEEGITFDAKKTTMTIGSTTSTVKTLQYAANDSIFSSNSTAGTGGKASIYANANYAPKLKAIDASKYNGTVILGSASSTVATDYKAGKDGSTLIAGSGNDVLTGGDGADVFVFNIGNGKGVGKNKVSGFTSIDTSVKGTAVGDYIQIADFDSSTHAVALTTKNNKLTISVSSLSGGKYKAAGTIELQESVANKKVVVVDGNKKVIGEINNGAVTTPEGLTYNEKTGIKTDKNFDGSYAKGVYVTGDYLEETTVKGVTKWSDVLHTQAPESVTINAADYGTKTSVINASIVNADVTALLIEGNASVKNVLTAPNDKSLLQEEGEDGSARANITTTLKGGLTQADNLYGSSLEGSKDYFWVTPAASKAKKDTIYNYDDGDVLLVQTTTNLTSADQLQATLDAMVDGKSADAVITIEKSTITLKDGAGKSITAALVKDNGEIIKNSTVTGGHTLPAGLVYDAKKTTISVSSSATSSADQVGEEGDVTIDLNGTVKSGNDSKAAYFNTVKTVNLSGVSSTVPTEAQLEETGENSVNIAIYGNSLANDLYAGGNKYSTNVLYGGEGAVADKMYGSAGKDIFIYQYGDGKDQIGDSKNNTYKYASGDKIILAAGDLGTLSRDDLYITDNGANVVIQLGTDTKKGTLTVIKDAETTPLDIYLASNTTTAQAIAGSLAGDQPIASNVKFDTLKYGSVADGMVKYNLAGTNLAVTGIDTASAAFKEETDWNAEDERPHETAEVYVNNISSAIKNINIAANDTLSTAVLDFDVKGNGQANSITLGAGGGTVDGYYATDTKGKVKATSDKLYGGAGNDVFVYRASDGTNDIGGKDFIYNYNSAKDVIAVDSIDDITGVKYNGSTIAFTIGSKNNVLTVSGINGASNIPSDAQITFREIGYDTRTKVETLGAAVTYTGFNKSVSSMSDLSKVGNPWTAYKTDYDASKTLANNKDGLWVYSDDPEAKAEIKAWHYEGNDWTNNDLKFTVKNIEERYEEAGGALDVVNGVSGYRPVGLGVEEPGGNVINVATYNKDVVVDNATTTKTYSVVNPGDFVFDSKTAVGAEGIHIKGITPEYGSDGIYTDDKQYVTVGNDEYRLANLDGNSSNGLELLKKNTEWDLNADDNWIYKTNGAPLFTIASGSNHILTVVDTVGAPQDITVKTDSSDGAHTLTFGDEIDPSFVKFDNSVIKGASGLHINGFEVGTKFTTSETIMPGTDSVAGDQPTVNNYEYVLAELDGDTKNGLELLKTNDHWTLTSEGWNFASESTAFTINLIPGTLDADSLGAPEGISVAYLPSLGADGYEALTDADDETSTVEDPSRGLYINFDVTDDNGDHIRTATRINTNNVVFSANTPTNVNGLHIDGLVNAETTVAPKVVLGEDTEYWLVDIDLDWNDGYELVKVNENWTPVLYDDADFSYEWAYQNDDGVKFTIDYIYNDFHLTSDSPIYEYVKPFAFDNNGNPVGINVNGNTITFDESLTAEHTLTTDDELIPWRALDLYAVTFDSVVATGADGIHIKGYGADTEAHVLDKNGDSVEYQLVDLDGNAGNGYELMKVDSGWEYKANEWSYTKDGFTVYFDSESGVAPTDNGVPNGVSISTASEKAADNKTTLSSATLTFGLEGSSLTNALNHMSFYDRSFGATGNVQFVGVPEDTQFTLQSYPGYTDEEKEEIDADENDDRLDQVFLQVANTDNVSANGLELVKVDANWTLSNKAWAYSDNSFAFSISADASIRSDANGTPTGVSYDSTTKELDLNADGSNNPFKTANLTITRTDETNNSKYFGINGLHIQVKAPTTTDPVSIAEDSRITVGGTTYQFVNLDNDTNTDVVNGLELMKADANWTLNSADATSFNKAKWTYSNANLEFTFVDNARNERNEAPFANDDGTPVDISVDGTTIDMTKLAVLQGADGNLNYLPIDLTKATAGTGANAVHIKGVKEGVTNGSDDGDIKIGDAAQTYQLIDLDGDSSNGLELMKRNEYWTYNVPNGNASADDILTWHFEDSVNKIKFDVLPNGNSNVEPTTDGTPTGFSYNSKTKVITIPADIDTNRIVLDKAVTTDTELHISMAGAAEGTVTIANDSETDKATIYTLYNADGKDTNGLELTYDGWLTVNVTLDSTTNGVKDTIDAFRYKTNSADYYLSGEQFGDGDTPTNVSVSGGTTLVFADPNNSDYVFKTGTDDFHLKGYTGTVRINGVDFTLKNLDGESKNGLELINNGWYKTKIGKKVTDSSSTSYVSEFVHDTDKFTLTGSSAAANINFDSDCNNIPDAITSYANKTFTFADANALKEFEFVFKSNSADKKFKVNVTDSTESYELKVNGLLDDNDTTTYKYTFGKVEETPQANPQFAASGCEVEDLINYDGGVSELDSILEVKALAYGAEADYGLDALNINGGSTNDLTSITAPARKRQQK